MNYIPFSEEHVIFDFQMHDARFPTAKSQISISNQVILKNTENDQGKRNFESSVEKVGKSTGKVREHLRAKL